MDTRYEKLFSLHPESQEFADERERLIAEELQQCSPEVRDAVFALQANLDLHRISHSRQEFMEHLVSLMSQNIQKLEEAAARLRAANNS